ncbi:MAG: hypothetical protein LBJ90_07135 [Treponema sp.]|jgi:hypothetical protein|nr:hypothetical protein [Treponema sp.]
MSQTMDLYPILKAYAIKNNSPYIDIDPFLAFLENYAVRKASEQPEWSKWASETEIKFWGELSGLVENNKCALMADTSKGRIYMPFYCVDRLQEIYRNLDNAADYPFPDEVSLQVSLPEDQIRIINLETGMGVFFEEGENTDENTGEKEAPPDSSSPIVKLIFPEDCGSALLLPPMIPRRLMEAAFLKMRHYLRSHGNREYALRKLGPQLAGKEKYLQESLDRVLIRPMDCLNNLENSGDFSFLFWAYFCSLIKNDIKKKKEKLGEDVAALQSAYIIDVCNGFFKARASKKREKEIAFRNLELRMGKLPGYYTLEEILKFTTDKGTPLTGLYTRQELEAYIKEKTTKTGDDELPEWLILESRKGGHWYIKKEKYLPLCARMLIDTRPVIKKAVAKRWMKLIKNFFSEPAMEKDAEFDKLLAIYTALLNPALAAMLVDEKLSWIYEKLERSKTPIPPSSKIFRGGVLIPMNELYVIRRKELLIDAKILLPFWYSIPILTALVAFFKNLGGKKKQKTADNNIEVDEEIVSEINVVKDIQNTARDIGAFLVPRGQTLDTYLAELEIRWSRLLNEQARRNLIEDVKSLARDNLRQIIRIHKKKRISRESLSGIASSLISHNTTLQGLNGQESLHLYLELYMVKLLINFKM